MKPKLMAFILSAGLGITGIAATAQPATPTPKKPCRHETLHRFTGQRAVYYNPTHHLSIYFTGYKCYNENCPHTRLFEEEETYESHDYEQTYYPDGTVKSECTGCHDSYYW